jgi:hypothetical protein
MRGSLDTSVRLNAVAALLGAKLDAPASSVADLEPKLRAYCGVLLKTPQFMLTGIEAAGELAFPRLRVCNGVPCSYEMCTQYARALGRGGRTIECDAGNRTVRLPAGAPVQIASGAGPVASGWLQSIELSKKARTAHGSRRSL